MPEAKDPTKALRTAAAALPDVVEGASCSQTAFKATKSGGSRKKSARRKKS